jgi:hypothetical protein
VAEVVHTEIIVVQQVLAVVVQEAIPQGALVLLILAVAAVEKVVMVVLV